jgi:transcriptional regulator with XRE-family HTH domain
MRLTSIAAKKNIGAILRERRIAKGISQNELANTANVTQTYLSLVEHGKRIPSFEVLKRIADILGEDAEHLHQEAGSADSDSIQKINRLTRRLIGIGNAKTIDRLLEFIETLG